MTIILIIAAVAVLAGLIGVKAGKLHRARAGPKEITPKPSGPAPEYPTQTERWIMEQEHELNPEAGPFPDHRNCRVCGPGPLKRNEIPSRYDHVYYRTDQQMCKPAQSQLVSSEIEGHPGWHTPMLDIDLPCRVIESSTPGHVHLYIDQPVKWKWYRLFLYTAMKCGIIERGFYQTSLERQATHLRPPWITKH